MSELVGAFIVLKFMKLYFILMCLEYFFVGIGGIMVVVCVFELWFEVRKCGNSDNMYRGVIFGVVLMMFMLYFGV